MQFVAFALKPLNSFNTAFQTSSSKVGTLQQDVHNLPRDFLSNFIQPELLAATSNDNIHSFDYENVANQFSNDELRIGTAARLHLIESSDELEGTQREHNFFLSIRQFYVECVWKISAKFPFTDQTISDLSMLDPCHCFHVTAAYITRLFKCFNKHSSTDDLDALLMELREYKLLPDSQLPV